VLRDKIYGRELATTPRKVMVTGRGGSGNARKSISSASGESNASESSASVVSSHARVAMEPDRSTRPRRWSSASDDFRSVINIARDTGETDRSDLYTISSHSTSTNDAGALSDVPSFISEYTFKTNSNSNPSARSRPSTMSSNPSRRSGQSDWLARIPRSYSTESLPAPIPETVEDTPIAPVLQGPVSFFDPFMFGYVPNQVAQPRRRSEISPLDEPTSGSPTPQRRKSRSPRRFRMFRKPSVIEPIDTQPPSSYALNFPSQYGQSSETANSRSASLPDENYSPIIEARRRNSSVLASAIHALQRIG